MDDRETPPSLSKVASSCPLRRLATPRDAQKRDPTPSNPSLRSIFLARFASNTGLHWLVQVGGTNRTTCDPMM